MVGRIIQKADKSTAASNTGVPKMPVREDFVRETFHAMAMQKNLGSYCGALRDTGLAMTVDGRRPLQQQQSQQQHQPGYRVVEGEYSYPNDPRAQRALSEPHKLQM